MMPALFSLSNWLTGCRSYLFSAHWPFQGAVLFAIAGGTYEVCCFVSANFLFQSPNNFSRDVSNFAGTQPNHGLWLRRKLYTTSKAAREHVGHRGAVEHGE
jgi:hypothetical protein